MITVRFNVGAKIKPTYAKVCRSKNYFDSLELENANAKKRLVKE